MPDDADPPRKFYGFKPAEFPRANRPAGEAPVSDPTPDPGVVPITDKRIDLNELIRAANGVGSPLGTNAVVNRSNEVHGVLRDNFERDQAAGLFHVEAVPDKKRRRRIRNYCLGLVVVNGPLGAFAWLIGAGAAIPFVCAIAGIGMFTALLTWQTFFLRTD
jgi:hypothetical protein